MILAEQDDGYARHSGCPQLPAAPRPAHGRPGDAVCRDQPELGIAIGSIGPIRRRCLDKLRDDPAIAALISAGAVSAAGEPPP